MEFFSWPNGDDNDDDDDDDDDENVVLIYVERICGAKKEQHATKSS